MGNIQFGDTQTLGAYWATSYHEMDPDGYQKPKPLKITHDPMEGFPNGRKPRGKLLIYSYIQLSR